MRTQNIINVKDIANESFNQSGRHEKQSNRYQPIQAKRIAEIFQDFGFVATKFKVGQAQNPSYKDFQTTSVEFKAPGTIGENTPEARQVTLTLKSPQLGRGAYQLMLGTYRLICSNGLYVGAAFGIERVRHTGDVENDLADKIQRILAASDRMHADIEAMKQVTLTDAEARLFARVAADLRLGNNETILSVEHGQLINARRNEDDSRSLWHVYNVVQENLSKYGVQYLAREVREVMPGVFEPKVIKRTSRPLKPLANNTIDFNQKLWTLATDLIGNAPVKKVG